jgi:hypothetical protein
MPNKETSATERVELKANHVQVLENEYRRGIRIGVTISLCVLFFFMFLES